MEMLPRQTHRVLCRIRTQDGHGQGAAQHQALCALQDPYLGQLGTGSSSVAKFWTNEFIYEFVNSLFCPMPSPGKTLLPHMQEVGMEKLEKHPKDYSCLVTKLS